MKLPKLTAITCRLALAGLAWLLQAPMPAPSRLRAVAITAGAPAGDFRFDRAGFEIR
jgi:hypothetical protein